MVAPAALAPLIRSAARLVAVARLVAAQLGRHPSGLAGMNDRMLRDIGLSRHDLWDTTPEPLLHALAVPLDRDRRSDRQAARERETRQALTRLWTEEAGRA